MLTRQEKHKLRIHVPSHKEFPTSLKLHYGHPCFSANAVHASGFVFHLMKHKDRRVSEESIKKVLRITSIALKHRVKLIKRNNISTSYFQLVNIDIVLQV